jgi:hypothetical protein
VCVQLKPKSKSLFLSLTHSLCVCSHTYIYIHMYIIIYNHIYMTQDQPKAIEEEQISSQNLKPVVFAQVLFKKN